MHMAEGSGSVVGPSPTVTASLLGKLCCPQPADISRKRRVSVNVASNIIQPEVCFSVAAHALVP